MMKVCFEGLETPELNPIAAETLEAILDHVEQGAECTKDFYETFLIQIIKLFTEYACF